MLWGKILMSSIWINESKETRLVWITIIALKDAEGRVYASVPGLADRAKVSIAECQEALRIMLSPEGMTWRPCVWHNEIFSIVMSAWFLPVCWIAWENETTR